MTLTREQVQAYLDERDEQDIPNPEIAAWEFATKSIEVAPQLAEALLQAWNEAEKLQRDFAAYRETAEEIQDCYANSHQDNWLFEKTLRRIANKSLDEVDNIGLPDGAAPQKIALNALETVWKRRVEHSKRKTREVRE